jgi:hypothetical protein
MHKYKSILACVALLATLPFEASSQSTPDSALGPLVHSRSKDEASGTLTIANERHYYYFEVPPGLSSDLPWVLVLHQHRPTNLDAVATIRLLKKMPPVGRIAARWDPIDLRFRMFQPVLREEDLILWRDVPTSDFNTLVRQFISYQYFVGLGAGTYAVEVRAPSSAHRIKYSLGVDLGNPQVSAWRFTYRAGTPFSVTWPLPADCVGIEQPCF